MSLELSEMARHSVLQQLAAAHDRWSEREQVQANPIERQGAHEFALRVLRAYRAELDDPEPVRPPDPIESYWSWLRRLAGQ